MDAGVDAYDQASGFSDKVATDIITAITVTYEAFGDSPLGLIQFAFGTLSWATYMELENIARTFPSSYVSMRITVDREHFLEDEDAQGRVTDAQVLAASAGWDPQDAIEDAVKKIQTVIDWGLSEELAPFSEEIAESIGGMIAQRLEDGSDLSDVVVPPEEFGPVDFLDPARIHVFVDGDAIAVVEGITYEPRREGEATLKVRTVNLSPAGGGAGDDMEIVVGKIEVGITPADTILPPGGSASLSAWATDAMFPAFVDLHEPENLQGTATISYNENTSFHEVTYTAPAQPNFEVPDTLTVLDTASTGARAAPDAPVRNARAVIRFAFVQIVPIEDCLDLGATHQFEATVQGLDNDALEWDASVGDMDDDGFYQAPPNSPDDGVAVIVARSVEHPELVDSTRVNIGCACTFSISVGGAIATDTPGRRLEFGALSGDVPPPEENIVLVIRIDEDTTGNYSLTMGISPEQLANAPGTYTLELSGEFPMQPPDLGYYNTPDATVSLDILNYIPEQLLVGTGYGSVEVVTEVGPGEFDERIEPFVMSFEIRVPEGWDPPSTVFGQLYACRVGGGES
jgi:hypothetical protein